VIQPFSNSDHCQVEFSVFNDCAFDESDDNIKRYNWAKADYDAMSNYITGINWFELLSTNLTADSLWDAFSNVLQTAVDMFVPVKYVSSTANIKCKRWYPAALRQAIIRKRCLWRRHRENPDDSRATAAYRDAEQKCRYLLRQYEIKREQKVIDSDNAGSFFRFVNGRLSCERGLGALNDDNGGIVTGDAERANLLNDYFTSMCTNDDGTAPVFDRVVPQDSNLESVEFTPDNVYAAIRKLKLNGAGGPDGFPPRLFKMLAGSLAEPLSLMFTSFMSVGKVPQNWRHATVTPVYKGGAASSVSNYRPISLTCVACKLMERVIVNKTLDFLRKHGVITKHQHGFLSGRSTTSNLLETLNDWTLAINDRKSVGVAYIDYKRAFDCVSCSKLLIKLHSYGISGQLLSWIESFLQNRTQETRVGSSLSDTTKLTSGVVQGSVIGPLLFVLFINDIAQLFNDGTSNCVCKLYADDLKLYSVLECNADASVLQDKLNAVFDWSNKWQLGISYTKCNVMYVSNMSNCNA